MNNPKGNYEVKLEWIPTADKPHLSQVLSQLSVLEGLEYNLHGFLQCG